MALSEQEQKALRGIEQALMAEDPKFSKTVTRGSANSSGGFTLRGVAVFVLGLVLLIAGVALSQANLAFVILGVLGFLVMFGAGVWMLRGKRTHKPFAAAGGKSKTKAQTGNSSLGDKMEENFRRRFEGQ